MVTASFTITDDDIAEPNETIIIPVLMRSTGTLRPGTVGPVTITILANDGHPDQPPQARTLTVTGPSAITETDGNFETGNYTIALSGRAFPSATTVTWTVTNGTTADADFVAASDRSGTVSFGTGDTTQTFTLTIAGDNLNEAAETFSVQVSVADQVADGGTAYGAPARTTITDDDPITATVTGSASANEGASVSTGITVTLTGGESTAPVVITYANADATGTLSIPSGMTTGMLSLTAVDDTVSEGSEMLSLVAGDFRATTAGAVSVAVSGAPTLTINADTNDNITVTIAPPASANTGQAAEFAVRMSNASAAAVTVAYTVALTVDGAAVMIPAGNITDMVSPIAAGRTSGVISVAIPADVNVAQSGSLAVTLTSATAASGGGTAMLGAAATATVAVSSDDPEAREARLEAPLASAGKGVGQLAAQAVAGRLAAAVSGAAGASSLTIAGREFTGTEALAAEFLAGGYATGARDLSADELLRGSGFNLAGGDGGRGFNFWGGGDFVSAEGDHDGVDYDGDTSAFTLGIDTGWKDGLIGVAVSRSDGDTDFTVTADNTEHTLETEVTSFHPYLTRRLGRSQLWLTAGHGSGDAEIKEPNDVVIKTDLTVTTAAFGITHARGDLFTGGLSALYSRAKLDAVTTGRRLPATAADSLRIKADAETGWTHGAWRPFMSFALRHDSGDGDTGSAGDLGGGVEWQKATASLRLSGATHLAGDGAEEDRLTLTLRKNAGRLNLGVNLTADDGVDTGNLLSGEWRF